MLQSLTKNEMDLSWNYTLKEIPFTEQVVDPPLKNMRLKAF
jgi:hypothetical protein